MKKLSHKDFIVVLGVVVAAIILITSVYFNEHSSLNGNSSGQPNPEKKIKPTVLLKKVIEKFSFRSSI